MPNVLFFQVGVRRKNLRIRMPRGNKADNHAGRDAHSAEARLTAHHFRVSRHLIQSRVSLLNSTAFASSHPRRAGIGGSAQRSGGRAGLHKRGRDRIVVGGANFMVHLASGIRRI